MEKIHKKTNENIGEKDFLELITEQCSLNQIQSYFEKVFISRGFEKDSLENKTILLVEEIGELAKAIRKHIGMGIDIDKVEHYSNLKEEIADVLIVLISIANKLDINISEALIAKEKINSERKWISNK